MQVDRYTKAVLTLIAVALCALAVGHWPTAPAASAAPAAAEAPGDRPAVATLRQERVATLREAHDVAAKMFASGLGSFEQVARVNHLLVDAELASATTPVARAEILNNAIKDARKQEAMSEQRVKTGTATVLESLEAKAYRLGLEIQLGEEGTEKGTGR